MLFLIFLIWVVIDEILEKCFFFDGYVVVMIDWSLKKKKFDMRN